MSRFAMSGSPRSRMAVWCVSCGALAALTYAVAMIGPAQAAQNEPIPNFAPDNMTGWLKLLPGDEFIPPESGPGPVRSDPARPYLPRPIVEQEPVKIADLTNPILQPWVIERM